MASRAFLRIACILLYMYHFFLICLYTTCVYNWRLGLIVVVSCTLRRVVCGRITGSLFGQNICLRSVCTFSFLVAFLSESLNYFLFFYIVGLLELFVCDIIILSEFFPFFFVAIKLRPMRSSRNNWSYYWNFSGLTSTSSMPSVFMITVGIASDVSGNSACLHA